MTIRFCIVVPSDEYRLRAGLRIRYERIHDQLGVRGTTLEIAAIDNFRHSENLRHDVYLLSKCDDARAFALAWMLSGAGKLVGIDLFDDYFSQSWDSRLTHRREWLRVMGGLIDFVLCSTPRLCRVAAGFLPNLPCHVLNDPFGSMDAESIGRLCRDKAERALATRTVRVGWFGMGDNPHFSVGLSDLVAFGASLTRIRELGYNVQLSILTNTRALTVPALESLRRLAIAYTLDEWTEERESAQIATSDICFLPVNGQAFSMAKSLNRAVSALTGGAQVLSSGYPLYAALGAFIYRDPATLVRDIEAGRPALREQTVAGLASVLKVRADPGVEADKLVGFLRSRLRRKVGPAISAARARAGAIGIVHGRRSTSKSYKISQNQGHLSIGTPFSPATAHDDLALRYVHETGRLDLHISETASGWLDPSFVHRLVPNEPGQNEMTRMVVNACEEDSLLRQLSLLHRTTSEIAIVTFYAPVMASLGRLLRTLLPDLQIFVDEMDPACWVDSAVLGNTMPRPAAA